jgi:hypothetical protein
MIYYNKVNIEGINLAKAYDTMTQIREDFVNVYSLRSVLKNALDDLNKTHDTNKTLQRMMRNIDRQIKNPETDYCGKTNVDLEQAYEKTGLADW